MIPIIEAVAVCIFAQNIHMDYDSRDCGSERGKERQWGGFGGSHSGFDSCRCARIPQPLNCAGLLAPLHLVEGQICDLG